MLRAARRLGLWATVAVATPAWVPHAAPTPRLTTSTVLSGVSCASPRMCVAVGYAVNAAGAPVPLVERWNGARWTLQRAAAPRAATRAFLFAVSCATARSCTAVGSVTRPSIGTVPFAERLDGGHWTAGRVPPPPHRDRGEVDYLAAVSCPTQAMCTAAGYAGRPQGTAGRALTERWTRARGWALAAARQPSGARAAFLSGVSCPSARRCTAVGYSTDRTGAGAALAERWTPAGWRLERIPTPRGATLVQLNDVSCPSPAFCTAAGSFDVAGIEVLLTERWDGARWRIGHPRYPADARDVALAGVSCPSPAACTAVGSLTDAAGAGEALAERGTRHGWAVQSTPAATPPPGTPAGPVNAGLAGVSCPSATFCVAVGSVTPLSGDGSQPVTLSWGT